MKFSCVTSELSNAFNMVSMACAKDDVKAVLRHVYVSAGNSQVKVKATDTDILAQKTIQSDSIEEEGECMFPTTLVKNALKVNTDAVFDAVVKDDKLSFCKKKYKNIPTIEPNGFPEEDFSEPESYHVVNGQSLKKMIKRTLFAIDPNNTKYTLGGVLLECTNGSVTAVATDGRRLSCQTCEAESVNDHFSEGTTIVPLKALNMLSTFINSDDERIKVSVDKNKIIFYGDDFVLKSRLVEGRFPRWKNILPKKNEYTEIILSRSTLLHSVQQASIVTEYKEGVTYTFSAGKTIELTASGNTNGVSRVEIQADYNGNDVSVKLDSKFMEEMLKSIDVETVSMFINSNAEKSILFETNDNYNYVIMPLT